MNDIAIRFNLVKSLVSDSQSPQKLIHYLNGIPELVDLYKTHSLLKNSGSNWLFHIMSETRHCKKWCIALEKVLDKSNWEMRNHQGNTIFLQAIESNHLKSALRMAKFGVKINVINNNKQNFADIMYENVKNLSNKMLKRKYYANLLFINKVLENKFPEALLPKHFNSIEKFLILVKEQLEKNKKESIFGYHEYWDDIIAFTKNLTEQTNLFQTSIRKRKLEEELPLKEKSKIIKKL